MNESTCQCYCRRCLIHEDCGGCEHAEEIATWGLLHPVVTEEEVG